MSLLTADYYRTTIKRPSPLYSGLDARLHALIGSVTCGPGMEGEFLATAREIDKLAASWKDLPDRVLRRRLIELKDSFRRRKKGYATLIPAALSAVREAAYRRVGLRPYIVQLAGALALGG